MHINICIIKVDFVYIRMDKLYIEINNKKKLKQKLCAHVRTYTAGTL